MRSSVPPNRRTRIVDSRYGATGDEWPVPDDDYVFILRGPTGDEWFSLHAHTMDDMMSRLHTRLEAREATRRAGAADATPSVGPGEEPAELGPNAFEASGLWMQYNVAGLGPWGNEPWEVTDFGRVIEDVTLALSGGGGGWFEERGPEAGEALLKFLEDGHARSLPLIIDDGSGEKNRFPQAEASWTETGCPRVDSVFYRYQRQGDEHWALHKSPRFSNKLLAALYAAPGSDAGMQALRVFEQDDKRLHCVLPSLGDLIAALRSRRPLGKRWLLHRFLRQAEAAGDVVVVQSAGLFPTSSPSTTE